MGQLTVKRTLENRLKSFREARTALVAASVLALSALAPQCTLAGDTNTNTNGSSNQQEQPVIFTMDTKDAFGMPRRAFSRNLQAGDTIYLTVYADNHFNSNYVGGIEFNLGYPTNNVVYEGAYPANPYISCGNAGIDKSNDLFYLVPGFSDNTVGLNTSRRMKTSPFFSPSSMQNQPGKSPVEVLQFSVYSTNSTGLGTFRLKDVHAQNIEGADLPTLNVPLDIEIAPNFNNFTNHLTIIDDVSEERNGQRYHVGFAEACRPFAKYPFSVATSQDMRNWETNVAYFSPQDNQYLLQWEGFSEGNSQFFKVMSEYPETKKPELIVTH